MSLNSESFYPILKKYVTFLANLKQILVYHLVLNDNMFKVDIVNTFVIYLYVKIIILNLFKIDEIK